MVANEFLGIGLRRQIRDEISAIAATTACDALETRHIKDALAWVDSGAQLFRLAKPATPPKHLVAYFAVVDGGHILLVDHKNAQLWLPPGGHAEPGEHPRATVQREMSEELGFAPAHPVGAPLMLTVTETVGLTAGHVDVSLWYVVKASRAQPIQFDKAEFLAVQWFPLDQAPLDRSDPHLGRFINKLQRERPNGPEPAEAGAREAHDLTAQLGVAQNQLIESA